MAPKLHLIRTRNGTLKREPAYLVFKDRESRAEILKPIGNGEEISLKMKKERFCPGKYATKNTREYCGNPLKDKHNQCYQCSRTDFQRCFIQCDADKAAYFRCCGDSAQRDHCYNQPRSVYLVSAGGNLKVGISFDPVSRWIGQGADYGAVIAKAVDGHAARRIEVLLSSEVLLGVSLTQVVTSNKKFSTLIGDTNFDSKLFLRLLSSCQELLRKQPQLLSSPTLFGVVPPEIREQFVADRQELFQLAPAEFTDLGPSYGGIHELRTRPKRRKAVEGSVIRGELIGLKGSWLVLRTNDGALEAWNVKQMISHVFVPSTEKSKSGLDKFF